MLILLVSGASRTVNRLAGHPNLGVLVVPKAWNNLPPEGTIWACDNGAFGNFDDMLFRAMLGRIAVRQDCKWVTAPDRVGDHVETAALWPKWSRIIRNYGHRPAFVAQDGGTVESLPWDEMGALFLGGTTLFKLGSEAARMAHEARRRGLWVHMGRVNTMKRMLYAHTIGCSSCDGSSFSKWADTLLPPHLEFLKQLGEQVR